VLKWFELGIETHVMKEQCDMEWWMHEHKQMKLEHGNEDHGNRALVDGQGVKQSRQRYNHGIFFTNLR